MAGNIPPKKKRKIKAHQFWRHYSLFCAPKEYTEGWKSNPVSRFSHTHKKGVSYDPSRGFTCSLGVRQGYGCVK